MAAPDAPFRAPTGTRDVLPPESYRWERLVARFAGHVEAAGYGLVQSPMFEELGVFERMGEGTDVVTKEMYDFRDKGDRHLALRPEGTASVARAFVQHRPPTPWKTWYVTPSFRYERPQAGRYRQHHQLGVEVIGVSDPDLDVEVIALLWTFYRSLGLEQLALHVNSMGDPGARARYLALLRSYLQERERELAPEDREKAASHPMRVLDSKRPASRAVVESAPTLIEQLDADAATRFERVREGLDALAIPHTVDPRLVRGLDYYTHTTFEIRSPALDAAQDTLGGGGGYDGLVASLGGPDTPGVGFGTGIERVLLACDAEGTFAEEPPGVAAFVVDVTDGSAARDLTFELRSAGIPSDRAFGGRSMKAQMRAADRSGATVALIVGEAEREAGTVTVRPLRSDGDQRLVARADVVDHVRSALR